MSNRDAVWKDIWAEKGLEQGVPLHHADGYDLLSVDEWNRMILQVSQPIGLRGDESILESGCGAGAFLASLLAIYPGLKVAGVDYSPSLLAIARQNFKSGEFHVADMTDLGFIANDSYDHAVSFGTFIYLSSEESARRAVFEMLRVTKSGGIVYIGEVSDLAKRAEAENIRRASHEAVKKISAANPDHLYLPKSFFQNAAEMSGSGLKIIDHSEFDLGDYQAARYRYSVYLSKR